MPFSMTASLLNPWNENKRVHSSKDGQVSVENKNFYEKYYRSIYFSWSSEFEVEDRIISFNKFIMHE